MLNSFKKEIIIGISVLFIITFIIFRTTFANQEEVFQVNIDDTITYYLNISYDNNNSSNSGYINVLQTLPDELEYIDYENIQVLNNSTNESCSGNILNNDIDYNSDTKTLSFIVDSLDNNCTLSVGIKTKVIETNNDIYNLATATLNNKIALSNELHFSTIESPNNNYNVNLTFDEDVPNVLEDYNINRVYNSDTNIKLNYLNFNGYKVNYRSDDVLIDNNSFIMPEHKVDIKTSIIKDIGNSVNYKVVGIIPENYSLPKTKIYNKNDTVYIDKLSYGDIVGNYKFKGWTSNDISIKKEDKFLMPDKQVTLVGEFEELKYDVCYQINPNNDEEECIKYKPGEEVTLIDNDNKDNYIFIGWNKEDKFIMPEADVKITGNWQLVNGLFTPLVELVNNETETNKLLDYFNIGDEYNLGIKITNNESFSIKDVIISIDETQINIIDNAKYKICSIECNSSFLTKLDDGIYMIDEIPAYSSFESIGNNINIKFDEDKAGEKISTSIEVIGSITDNDYYLEKNVKDTKEFNVASKLSICNNTSNNAKSTLFQYHITSTNNDNPYDTWITLEDSECKNVYLESGTYNISEIIPQEWNLVSVDGAINSNNQVFNVNLNESYNINFNNIYKTKGYYHSSGRVSGKIVKGDGS